jgi:hypothetical protein
MFSIKKNITGVKSGRICEEKGTRCIYLLD